MFELKDGQSYKPFNNINIDPFTWKEYNLTDALVKNKHDMLELQLNISDAVLKGSGSSVNKMKEVVSRY